MLNKTSFFKTVKNLPKYNHFGSNVDVHVIEKYNMLIKNGIKHEDAIKSSLGYGMNVLEEIISEDDDYADISKLKATLHEVYKLGVSLFGNSFR